MRNTWLLLLVFFVFIVSCFRKPPQVTIGVSLPGYSYSWGAYLYSEIVREFNLYQELNIKLVIKDAHFNIQNQRRDIDGLPILGKLTNTIEEQLLFKLSITLILLVVAIVAIVLYFLRKKQGYIQLISEQKKQIEKQMLEQTALTEQFEVNIILLKEKQEEILQQNAMISAQNDAISKQSDIIEISQISTGHIKITKTNVSVFKLLNELYFEIIDNVNTFLTKKPLKVDFQFEIGENVNLFTDPIRI